MGKTKISYATKVWNPVEGCAKCSPGCDNCWAQRQNHVWAGRNDRIGNIARYVSPWNGTLRFAPERLHEPETWSKPQRVFAFSRTDVGLFTASIWETFCGEMNKCPQHRFLLLTKRPEKVKILAATHPLPANAWIGTSICNYHEEWKAWSIASIPAAGHWLSIEPMLGPVDIRAALCDREACNDWGASRCDHAECASRKIDWVVCGGESGTGARKMRPEWARSLRDQCANAGVPFYLKQWGDNYQQKVIDRMTGCDTRVGVPFLDGQSHRTIPSGLMLPGEAAHV